MRQAGVESFHVLVAYGTSQKVHRLYPGEFLIGPQHEEAYREAGLSYPTKFDVRRAFLLTYDPSFFEVPPHAPFGQTPRLGLLHPSLVPALKQALE